jgi:hypothetical protein
MYPKGLPQWTKAFGRMKTLAKNDVRTFYMKLRHDAKFYLSVAAFRCTYRGIN